MEKSNINRIIRKFLSARFSPETEEKVQKWIIEDKDIEAKEKASLEYWRTGCKIRSGHLFRIGTGKSKNRI